MRMLVTTWRRSLRSLSTMTAQRTWQDIRNLVRKRVNEREGWLVNGKPEPHPSRQESGEFLWQILTRRVSPPPNLDETFPVLPLDWEKLKVPPGNDRLRVTWLGHASLLLQIGGCNILTDPVFSQRCSPSQWFGPKRYRPPPCRIDELVDNLKVHAVVISHNHYDHLDLATVQYLHPHVSDWVVPLGLHDWFTKHICKGLTIHELDWHECVELGPNLTITSLPMRHWSNRVGDRDQTLWCGYSIASQHQKFLFPGDTAWFDDLALIGEQYGPFDAAAIPIGAYEPYSFMKYVHMHPPDAVRMKDAVKARHAVPIHWGTFPLTLEAVMEPRQWLEKIMKDRKDCDSFVPWLIGEMKEF